MSNLPVRYAWCFSHGALHTFDPATPWCTALWVWLAGDNPSDAEADKHHRYGRAVFLHDLREPEQQTAVIELSDHDRNGQ